MAKKTVIKRHAKLAPLSVEFQRAVALEERSNAGASQDDLLGIEPTVEAEFTTVEDPPKPVVFNDEEPPARKERSDKGKKRPLDPSPVEAVEPVAEREPGEE
jgi:recombinational DNA repair protein RecT